MTVSLKCPVPPKTVDEVHLVTSIGPYGINAPDMNKIEFKRENLLDHFILFFKLTRRFTLTKADSHLIFIFPNIRYRGPD